MSGLLQQLSHCCPMSPCLESSFYCNSKVEWEEYGWRIRLTRFESWLYCSLAIGLWAILITSLRLSSFNSKLEVAIFALAISRGCLKDQWKRSENCQWLDWDLDSTGLLSAFYHPDPSHVSNLIAQYPPEFSPLSDTYILTSIALIWNFLLSYFCVSLLKQ